MVSYSMLLKGSWGPSREPLLSEMFLTQDTLRNAEGDAQQSCDADITITITGETVPPRNHSETDRMRSGHMISDGASINQTAVMH